MVEEGSTREQVEEIINNEEPIKEKINEEIKEEILKSKHKSEAEAKPRIKFTKEPVEPVEAIQKMKKKQKLKNSLKHIQIKANC